MPLQRRMFQTQAAKQEIKPKTEVSLIAPHLAWRRQALSLQEGDDPHRMSDRIHPIQDVGDVVL